MKKWLKWIFIYVFKKTERPNAISKAFKTMDCERFFLKISVAKGKFRPRLLARLPTTTSSWAKATLVRQSIDATEKKRQFHLSLSLFWKKKQIFFFTGFWRNERRCSICFHCQPKFVFLSLFYFFLTWINCSSHQSMNPRNLSEGFDLNANKRKWTKRFFSFRSLCFWPSDVPINEKLIQRSQQARFAAR